MNYGPDRQRWKQILTNAYGTETTYYVGNGHGLAPGQLEVVFNSNGTTNYRHYIYAGSEPVAVYSRTSSASTMSYLLEDHQGGVSAITSNTGGLNGGESFTAFGQHREPSTWSGAPSQAELLEIASFTRQGYTFQMSLGQSMGLNHMNGRVQDPIEGRFISPDPVIQDPSNAQNYNRYTYALNNPLTFIDPTGFYCGGAPAIPDDGGDYGNYEDGNFDGEDDGGGDQLPEIQVNAPCTPPEVYNFPPIPLDLPPSPGGSRSRCAAIPGGAGGGIYTMYGGRDE